MAMLIFVLALLDYIYKGECENVSQLRKYKKTEFTQVAKKNTALN
jgi:hypothetical protein